MCWPDDFAGWLAFPFICLPVFLCLLDVLVADMCLPVFHQTDAWPDDFGSSFPLTLVWPVCFTFAGSCSCTWEAHANVSLRSSGFICLPVFACLLDALARWLFPKQVACAGFFSKTRFLLPSEDMVARVPHVPWTYCPGCFFSTCVCVCCYSCIKPLFVGLVLFFDWAI